QLSALHGERESIEWGRRRPERVRDPGAVGVSPAVRDRRFVGGSCTVSDVQAVRAPQTICRTSARRGGGTRRRSWSRYGNQNTEWRRRARDFYVLLLQNPE